MRFETLKDVLLFAVRKEHDARELYLMFRDKVKDPGAKQLLEELANQELGHQRMLEKALETENIAAIGNKSHVQDLHLNDYVASGDIGPDSRPDDVMAFAIKSEQASYSLYKSLLKTLAGTELESIFSHLAQEELSHKERLEKEYEEHFMYWM
jgi:rubrerythrin